MPDNYEYCVIRKSIWHIRNIFKFRPGKFQNWLIILKKLVMLFFRPDSKLNIGVYILNKKGKNVTLCCN
jgi:hypothetical protein